MWTFIVALVATCFFAAIERYGFTLPVFARWVRGLCVGRRKISSPWWV
jgi:intracellular multiplication protein IcmT